MTIEKHYVNTAEAAEKLRAIHSDVQDKFHDQWDWIAAEFYVAILVAEIERRNEALKQHDELLDRTFSAIQYKDGIIVTSLIVIRELYDEWRELRAK